jgi:internalin A
MTTPKWALGKIELAKELELTYLDLKKLNGLEALEEIPASVFELSQLREIDLSGNSIIDIAMEFSRLQELRVLNLNKNRLINLPEAITYLPNLTILTIGDNKLTILPKSIGRLKNLAALHLYGNQLSVLPEAIGILEKLLVLDVEDNQISKLPEVIIRLPKLSKVYFANNQFTKPPQEIMEKGLYAIQEYFRQIKEVGQDRLYEAKLLILGEGGAGKTTLARKIENSNNFLLKEELSTEGVEISSWSFLTDENKSFRVNTWDFGGQEIYHATHQFFLTRRSLYILVADTRKEDTDFYYWLNIAELLSDNSPLLIIKNEKQDRHREINERQLRGQFENLKDILSTNLATNRGLREVKDAIKHYIKNLPHIGATLPKTWVRVREILERDEHDYISLEKYLSICQDNGFVQIKDSLQLSSYLHDIGVFLHFQDDPLLRKTVILKPNWATDAVYKVLDNKNLIKNLGRFTRRDIDSIWESLEYEAMRDELLQLMMKFKLCYEIPNQKGAYIAPQLLTENQPSYEWHDDGNLLLRYVYEFMPKGILTQFIVAMHQYVPILHGNPVVWKSGAVLIKSQAVAEVIEDYGKRQIFVCVAGVHKKELMTVIMYELDKIHATYNKLRYDKLIPCNCDECRQKKEPYFYRYETLQKFIGDGQVQIQCQQSYKMVNVWSLIDDVLEKEYLRKEGDSPIAQYIIHGDYIDQGEKKMAKINQTIKDSIVHGSVIAAESIQDSFNVIEKAGIKDDLKGQLKLLTQAVEVMIKELPKEKAEEVAEDMKVLAEQATKEKPNPKWYNVSIDGLVAAAQSLGKVGDAVIELTDKVRKILTGGLL